MNRLGLPAAVTLVCLFAITSPPATPAPQSGTQRITLKGCGISFDAPTFSGPWKVIEDIIDCRVVIEAEVGGRGNVFGVPDKLRIQLETDSFLRDSCDARHKRDAENKGGFGRPPVATPAFLPPDWYPRTTEIVQSHKVCMELPQGQFKGILGFTYKKIETSEHAAIRTILSNIGNAMRARGSAKAGATISRPATPAPMPAPKTAPAPYSPPASSAPPLKVAAPVGRVQMIRLSACGISFDAPVLSNLWTVAEDRTPRPGWCEALLKTEVSSDEIGGKIFNLRLVYKTADKFHTTCSQQYESNKPPSTDKEDVTYGFLPPDWFPHSWIVLGHTRSACLDFPNGQFTAIFGHTLTRTTPDEYAATRSVLTNAGRSMRAKVGGSAAGSSSVPSTPAPHATPPAPTYSARPVPAPAPSPAKALPPTAPAPPPAAKSQPAPAAIKPLGSKIVVVTTSFLSELSSMKLPMELCRAEFMPDQKSLLLGDRSGYVGVWELGITREIRSVLPRDAGGEDCAWQASPNRRWLAYARKNGADVWDLNTNQKIRSVETKKSPFAALISPDGKWMILFQADNPALVVFDVKTGEQKAGFEKEKQGELGIALPVGNLFAVNRDGTVIVWDLKLGREIKRVKVDQGGGMMAFSPDGRWLAVAEQWAKTRIRLVDVSTGTIVREFNGAEKETSTPEIDFVFFSPNGAQLYVVCRRVLDDSTGVQIYDVATGKLLGGLPHRARWISFSQDGRTLLLTDHDDTLHFYSVKP